MDFEGVRRHEVKRYIEERYGIDYVCSVGAYTTLQVRAAFSDISRHHGKMAAEIRPVSVTLDEEEGSWKDVFLNAAKKPKLKSYVLENSHIINEMQLALGQPKSASIHASAMLIVPKYDEEGNPMTIYDWLPVRKTDEGMLVCEWEGYYVEAAGFLKEDILGIRQLDKIRSIFDYVEREYGDVLSLENIPLEDPTTMDLFREGLNEDVFHLGSQGLKGLSKELVPEDIEDLIAMIALHRPGAMESGSDKRYVKIKHGEEEAEYDYMLREITEPTYGQYIYQEQVMKATQILGGFSLVDADGVRRAMGKKIKELMDSYKKQFLDYAINQNNCPIKEAEEIWNKLELFAGYGFNKCIDGEEKIYRAGLNKSGKSTFNPTIAEMYKIKNDFNYAKKQNKLFLRRRYLSRGYGSGFSLKNERLVKNKIKDIRYEGIRYVYEIKVESGERIKLTANHKSPTQRGEVLTEDLITGKDYLYVNKGHEIEDTVYRFGKGEDNYPKKGQQGFQKKNTSYTSLKRIEKELSEIKCCEKCGRESQRLENHHKDGNHGNNNRDNLIRLCSSCHKEEEYLLGRVKMGEKGLLTKLERIVSIERLGEREVYDVEMETPYHSFCTQGNIVTCNSHAAAYAITGYITQYLKAKYPLAFWTTAFQFAQDEDIPRYLDEVEQTGNGMDISFPDINESAEYFTSNSNTNILYWSLSRIKQVGDVASRVIVEERDKNGYFYSLEEFYERVPKNKCKRNVVENLILAGCFDNVEKETIQGIPMNRRILIAQLFDLANAEVPEIYKSVEAQREYWWSLKQVTLSGKGFIDYEGLVKSHKKDLNNLPYTDIVDFFESYSKGQKTTIAGLITKVIHQKMRTKEAYFAKVMLLVNDKEIQVTIWNELWKLEDEWQNPIRGAEGDILIIDGLIDKKEPYNRQNILQTQATSKYKIIKKK